jgi:uncharacterized membrane protein
MTQSRLRVSIALGLAVLFSLPMLTLQLKWPVVVDFRVYLTAANLVRHHQSAHLYEDADNGTDPQLQPAPPQHVFAQTARAEGLNIVGLYLYPPTLADVLVPLTGLSFTRASVVWELVNLLALAATVLVLIRLFCLRIRSAAALAIAVAMLLFFPVLSGIHIGQVTSILLLLWALGTFYYVRGNPAASGAMLALATALKLTPVLALLPILLWRDWRWARWYCGTLAACVAAMLAINGPGPLADYCFHVMPAMSRGFPCVYNLSLASAVQIFYLSSTGTNVTQVYLNAPHFVVMAGKALSLAAIALALLQIFRLGKLPSLSDRSTVLAMLALVSIATAPVSWPHAYSVAFLPLALLWHRAFTQGVSDASLWLLAFVTFEMSYLIEKIGLLMSVHRGLTHGPAFAIAPLLTPVSCLVLAFFTLHTMRNRTQQL